MKRPESRTSLTAGQAQYVLSRMIQDRVVSAGQVARYLSDMQREINDLEMRLAGLRAAQGGGGRPARTAPAAAPSAQAGTSGPAAPRPAQKKRPLSRQVRASQRLQGLYLSLMKQTSAEKRPAFRKIAMEQGREEAVKRMQAALKK